MIAVPNAEDLARVNADFDRDWGGVDNVLYELCRRHSGHTDRRSATARVAMIGRAYSAGLERRVTPPKGQQAIVVIADYFERHGAEVDEILAPLHPIDEPLSLQGMATIVSVHGRFAQLLVGVTTDGLVATLIRLQIPSLPQPCRADLRQLLAGGHQATGTLGRD